MKERPPPPASSPESGASAEDRLPSWQTIRPSRRAAWWPGDGSQDRQDAGSRHGLPGPDYLPGRLVGHQPAFPRKHFPRPVRGSAHFLQQLADAPQIAHTADRCCDGTVHRRRGLSSRPKRRHHNGGKTSFMGLGGPNLVKGAIGKSVDAETLGGAETHTAASGVAHHRARDDQHCLEIIRQMVSELPRSNEPRPRESSAPLLNEDEIYSVLPADHRLPYDLQEIVLRIFDREGFLEFMAAYAPEVLCANARLAGRARGSRRQPARRVSARRIHSLGRHHLHRKRPQDRPVRRDLRPSQPPAGLLAGCQWLHGRPGSRGKRDYSRRRGNGRNDGLRPGSQDRGYAEPCQRRRLLRHGGTGFRPQFHF